MNLSAGYRVVFHAANWRLGYDAALPDAAPAVFPVSARAATHLLINEVWPQPNPEAFEIVNPTGAAVSLSGWNLAAKRGNLIIVIYTFTTGTIGAWGSGSEYLRILLPTNSLPNGNLKIMLRQMTIVIDETTYSQSVANGQSWSRLKDPITGVPLDTDNDAANFYISLSPTPGRPNDRHSPLVAVAKTASRAVAAPGETITYSVFYNNTGTGMASFVWVNDTLPAGVVYVSSSVPYATLAGSTYGWLFTNVMPGTSNAFSVTVQVTAAASDGQILGNTVSLDYSDQLRQPLPRSQAWVNTTVSRPVITVAKTASPSTAIPGDIVTFTIYYNNTGSAPAGTLTIKDVLPSGMTYVGSSPSPTWTDGRTFYWNMTNVAPGSHSVTLSAQVDATASGSQLVNWVFLNYTTTGGYALAGSSASSVVAIPELSDFVFVVVVPFLVLGLRRRFKDREARESG